MINLSPSKLITLTGIFFLERVIKLTQNQKEFFELQKRVFRWQEYAENKGLDVSYFFPEKPQRITKQFLKELKSEIPKRRWEFLEQYAEENGRPYKRTIQEKIKAQITAKKSAQTRSHSNQPSMPSVSAQNGQGETIDEQQKAFNYVLTFVSEIDTGTNAELIQEFINILMDFVNNVDNNEARIFNQNFEKNKALIDTDFVALAYESGDETEINRLSDEVLDMLFSGTNYNPDLSRLRALTAEVGQRSRTSYALAYEAEHFNDF